MAGFELRAPGEGVVRAVVVGDGDSRAAFGYVIGGVETIADPAMSGLAQLLE